MNKGMVVVGSVGVVDDQPLGRLASGSRDHRSLGQSPVGVTYVVLRCWRYQSRSRPDCYHWPCGDTLARFVP